MILAQTLTTHLNQLFCAIPINFSDSNFALFALSSSSRNLLSVAPVSKFRIISFISSSDIFFRLLDFFRSVVVLNGLLLEIFFVDFFFFFFRVVFLLAFFFLTFNVGALLLNTSVFTAFFLEGSILDM